MIRDEAEDCSRRYDLQPTTQGGNTALFCTWLSVYESDDYLLAVILLSCNIGDVAPAPRCREATRALAPGPPEMTRALLIEGPWLEHAIVYWALTIRVFLLSSLYIERHINWLSYLLCYWKCVLCFLEKFWCYFYEMFASILRVGRMIFEGLLFY